MLLLQDVGGAGGDGAISAAWRHVYPGNIRDIAFTMSADGGRTFTPPLRVSEDQWAIDGCPENGPSITVDASRRIHLVWPTLVPGPTPASEPTLGLFFALSCDGLRFTGQRIPTTGVPRHPQIIVSQHSEVVVVWDEQTKGRPADCARAWHDDGPGNGAVHATGRRRRRRRHLPGRRHPSRRNTRRSPGGQTRLRTDRLAFQAGV